MAQRAAGFGDCCSARAGGNLSRAMSWGNAAYLTETAGREPAKYTPDASRRARGVELWAAIRSLGRSGLREIIERNCRQAKMFADRLRTAGFTVLNEVVLNQVLVSFGERGRDSTRDRRNSGRRNPLVRGYAVAGTHGDANLGFQLGDHGRRCRAQRGRDDSHRQGAHCRLTIPSCDTCRKPRLQDACNI